MKKKTRLFMNGTVCALVLTIGATAGVPAFASTVSSSRTDTAATTAASAATDHLGGNYGKLTPDEVSLYNSICDRLNEIFELSDEKFEQHSDEVNSLFDRLGELDEKAGWTAEYEYDDMQCLECEAVDYGDLTAAEINELEGIYSRYDAIASACGTYDESVTDEEYDRRLAKYTDELEKLDKRAAELEIKAGWYTAADDKIEMY